MKKRGALKLPAIFGNSWARQDAFIVGVKVEPFLCGITGNVRKKEAGSAEERPFLGHCLELLHRPGGNLEILLVLIAMQEHAPVHKRVVAHREGRHEFPVRLHAHAASQTRENSTEPHAEFKT